MTDDEWMNMGVMQMLSVFAYLIYFAKSFPATNFHIFNTMLLSVYMCFISLCGSISINEPVSLQSIQKTTISTNLFFACLVVAFNFYFFAKVNREFIGEVISKLIREEEYKFILDNLEHSIIMVEND